MNSLDYEIDNGGPQEGEDDIVFMPTESEEEQQAKAVDFSKKVIDSLEDILKVYNSQYSKKVKLCQAKKMYYSGAKMKDEESSYSANEWGLARVNLCLRIIAGEIGELNLDISRKTSYNKLVDITDQLTPTDEDFKKAQQDALNYDLDHHFDDVDELYLAEEPISYLHY